MCIATSSKDLVEIVLEPSNIGVQTSEFPDSVDSFVPVEIEGVGVSFDGDFGERFVGVFLVGDAELVVTNLRRRSRRVRKILDSYAFMRTR